MTQSDGWFDFMVNGGGAVGIQFGKSPFRPKEKNVFVPWNEVRSYTKGTVSPQVDPFRW